MSVTQRPWGRVMVPFHAPGEPDEVDEELAWGQQEIWRAMVRQGNWFPLGGIRELPAGTGVDDIAAELSYLVSRNQTMRTRLRLADGARPRQVVSGSGEVALEIVEAGDTDPGEVAAAVLHRYQHVDYDFERDWPVLMAVVRRHGQLTHQISIFCHLVTDALGGGVMLADVAARPSEPVAGTTSLEQARWQRSPAGERTDRAARRYWENLLRTVSPPATDASTDPRTPRHWEAAFTSPAAALAVRAIAERVRVDTPAIVLALVSVALARVTGMAPVVLRPIVSNRFRPGLGAVVANVSQNGLCVLDVADTTVDEAIARTLRASMAACKHAYFDPIAMDDLIARISAERGVDVDVRCFYSDRRTVVDPVAMPTPDDIRAALPGTTFGWVAEHDVPLERLMWYVDDAPGALRFSVFADTHFLSPADVERCLYEVEKIAVAAAFDASVATRAVERVAVPFDGPGAGDEPLTWGQQELYAAMTRQRTWMPMGGTKELTPDTTVAQIVAELGYLLGRHQSLRTRLRFTGDGTARQVVPATGEAWLDIVDAGITDPAEVAEAVHQRLRTTDFDVESDWPIRVALIRSRGVLTHQVTIMCHLAADASGAGLMLMDAFARSGAPITGMQGLDLARWQASPAGQRQHTSAMRHWEKGMRSLPVADRAGSTARREPRHWQGQARSTAAYLAVRAIVARTGADSGHVLLALWAMAYGRHTSRSPVALRPLVNNRFRRDLADVVAPITQNGLCVVDVAGVAFDDVLDRVRQATTATYKHAFFDPAGLADLIARVSADRGPVLDTACFFNDRRDTNRAITAGPAPTAEQIRAALPATTLHWNGGRDAPYETAFVHFEDEPGILSLLFQVDTHCLSVEDMQSCILGMEAIAVEVACVAEARLAPADGGRA